MPPKKQKYSQLSQNPKWNENGTDQGVLEDLIKAGCIDNNMLPSVAKNFSPVFQDFTLPTFTYHLKNTRLHLKGKGKILFKHSYKITTHFIVILDSAGDNSLEKLMGIPTKFTATIPKDVQEEPHPDELAICSGVQFLNPPVEVWTMLDHDQKCTKVFVSFTAFCGVHDYDIKVSDCGEKVTISFNWPAMLLKANALFPIEASSALNVQREIKANSFKTALLNSQLNEKSSPRGTIVIDLSICVQKEKGTWGINGLKDKDGTKHMLLEFKSVPEELFVEETNASYSFKN